MLEESGADAVMIGRGSQGRPWLPGLVAGAVGAKDLAAIALADLVEEHYGAMLSHYGEAVGLRHARKHLGWYLDRFAAAVRRYQERSGMAVMTGREPQRRHPPSSASSSRETSLADVEPASSSHTLKKAA